MLPFVLDAAEMNRPGQEVGKKTVNLWNKSVPPAVY